MRANFRGPLRRLLTELAWLSKEFHAASASTLLRREQLAAEMAVIRLYDAWARYCRELVILSASGNAVTLSGNVVPAVVRNRSDVIPMLLSTYPRARFEPKWADSAKCIDAATRLRIANLRTLAGAIGATNSPAEEIRSVRNYFAHRHQESAARAIAFGGFVGAKPIVFDLSAYRSAGETFFESWVKGLVLVATSASQ